MLYILLISNSIVSNVCISDAMDKETCILNRIQILRKITFLNVINCNISNYFDYTLALQSAYSAKHTQLSDYKYKL